MPKQDHEDQALERLRWHLGRAEGWISNADTKATILLGLNGAWTAGVLAIYPDIVRGFLHSGLINQILAGVFAVAIGYSCIAAAWAVLPNLGSPKSGGSILHFMDVHHLTLTEFRSISREMSTEREITALEHQVYNVSRIAANKYRRMRQSVFGLLVGVVSGLLILFTQNVLPGV